MYWAKIWSKLRVRKYKSRLLPRNPLTAPMNTKEFVMPTVAGWTLAAAVLISGLVGCSSSSDRPDHTDALKEDASGLPVLGPMETVTGADGTNRILMRKMPRFALEDHYGNPFSEDSMRGQVVVVDFFFASCPGICIDMSQNLSRIYRERTKDAAGHGSRNQEPALRLVSYTIDPERDTREVLAAYAAQHGVLPPDRTWLFVRGLEKDIHRLAEQYYLLSAGADSTAPGGFLHSGQFLLLDPLGRIRGLYDGTNQAECAVLLRDLRKLQAAYSRP